MGRSSHNRHVLVPLPVLARVELFPLCAAAGAIAALALASALAYRRGLPVSFLAVLAGIVLAAQALYSVASVIFTGRRARLVLYHRAGLCLLAAAIGSRFAAQPVALWLDIVTPALFVFVALGRIGCWAAGCCYGRPSRFGAVYSDAHSDAVTAPFIGVPLFPVQLAESAAALFVAAIGAFGVPFQIALACYAGARFLLEYYRGEPGRPRALNLTEAQWTSSLIIILVYPLAALPLVAVALCYRPILPDHEVQIAQALSCCARVERAISTTSSGVSLTREYGRLQIRGATTPSLTRHIAFLDDLVCPTLKR